MRTRWEWRIKRVKSALKQWIFGQPRTPEKVKQKYDKIWDRFKFDDLTPGKHGKLYTTCWRHEYQVASGSGIARVHLFCLKNVINMLKPRSVLEVGFGRGFNLIALAAHFPEIRFSGVELSNSGFKEAQALLERNVLPQALIEFIPFSIRDVRSIKQIDLHQGSAVSLPFEDNSFDIVFTRQALEQMENIRDKALNDICRVAQKHVVMFEAFRDWNETGMRRNRNMATNYFAARISDLNQYGLRPVYIKSDLPHKIYMRVGMVVAKKENKAMNAKVNLK